MKYGLSEKQLNEIIAILSTFTEIEEAILFGSRAIDTYKEASDVDIALKGDKVTASLAAKLKYQFEEDTYLPFFFDFVAYATITNEALKEHIDTKGVLIYRAGWRECKLGDVIISNAQSITKDYPHKTIRYLDTGSITCGKIHSIQEYSLKSAPSRAKRLAKEHDIVYSTVRPIQRHYGYVVNPPENLVVSTGFAVIETNKKLAEPLFIYNFLLSKDIVETLDSIAEGSMSAYPSLKPSDIANLDILLPPIPEQRAIASVLSSLEDKIDLLHRQNKTLEAMAETLFRQWFVVEANKDSKIGKITELIEFNPKRQLPKGAIAPYLDMANVSTSVFHPENWYEQEFNSGTKFINGDTLLARITPCLENGKSTYVTFLEDRQVGWGSTEFIVMRSRLNLHPFFAYTLARNTDFRDYAEGCLEGTSGRQRVNVDHLANYEIIIPPSKSIQSFNEIVSSIVPKLHFNFEQIRTLSKLRDTLLPKLMSGEVRVKM